MPLGNPFWLISYHANENFFSKIINSLEITWVNSFYPCYYLELEFHDQLLALTPELYIFIKLLGKYELFLSFKVEMLINIWNSVVCIKRNSPISTGGKIEQCKSLCIIEDT